MQITIDELVENPEKYFAIVINEDIFITKDGYEIARITRDLGEIREALRAVETLTGILPPDVDLETARMERLMKKGVAPKLFGILPKDADLEQSREERLARL